MTKGSLVFREGLEIVAVAVVFIVCLGLGRVRTIMHVMLILERVHPAFPRLASLGNH